MDAITLDLVEVAQHGHGARTGKILDLPEAPAGA